MAHEEAQYLAGKWLDIDSEHTMTGHRSYAVGCAFRMADELAPPPDSVEWLDNHQSILQNNCIRRMELRTLRLERRPTADVKLRIQELQREIQEAETTERRWNEIFLEDTMLNGGPDNDVYDEESDEDYFEVVDGGDQQKRRRKKPRPKFQRPIIRGTDLLSEEITDVPKAHELILRGINNLRTPKDRYTERAYRESVPELEDPSNPSSITLMDVQREGLGRWMESTKTISCFLLADEMGLGKTWTTMARIRVELQIARGEDRQSRFLVVVPRGLLSMWTHYVESCPSIKLCIYYGDSAKKMSQSLVEAAEVILTTYDTLYRQYDSLKRIERDFRDCHHGFEPFIAQVAANHQLRNPGKRLPEAMKIQTTRKHAPLFSVDFFEIILDEAHAIKGTDSLRGEATRHVKAKNRVCITGTPLQNRTTDVFSLFRFMRLAPFDQVRFFNKCFVAASSQKNDQIWERTSHDRERVLGLVLQAVQLRRRKSDMFNGKPLTELQPYLSYRVSLPLCGKAQATQKATRFLWDPMFTKDEDATPAKMTKGQLFQIMGTARADANHPRLKEARYGDLDADETEIELLASAGDDFQVSVRRIVEQVTQSNNGGPIGSKHDLQERFQAHSQKFGQWQQNRSKFTSEIAADEEAWFSDKLIATISLLSSILDQLAAFLETIDHLPHRKETQARSKIIVFAEWLSFLDLLDIAIQKQFKMNSLRLDGSVKRETRDQIISQFEEVGKDYDNPDHQPDEIMVLLATTKTASEGINLVHAKFIIFPMPTWNPFAEEQAIGRANRIGQQATVSVFRISAGDSLEDRVMRRCLDKRSQEAMVREEEQLLDCAERVERWSVEEIRRFLRI